MLEKKTNVFSTKNQLKNFLKSFLIFFQQFGSISNSLKQIFIYSLSNEFFLHIIQVQNLIPNNKTLIFYSSIFLNNNWFLIIVEFLLMKLFFIVRYILSSDYVLQFDLTKWKPTSIHRRLFQLHLLYVFTRVI